MIMDPGTIIDDISLIVRVIERVPVLIVMGSIILAGMIFRNY
jgi:hypothetical protein